jgi:hypothetical protein
MEKVEGALGSWKLLESLIYVVWQPRWQQFTVGALTVPDERIKP